MGCRHSSSPPESPVKMWQNGGRVVLKSKISVHRAQIINHQTSDGIKSLSTSRLSITTKKVNDYDKISFIYTSLKKHFRNYHSQHYVLNEHLMVVVNI
jgi:hypothetical protein